MMATDIYKTKDESTGEIETRSKRKDQISEDLTEIHVSDASVYNRYKELQQFEPPRNMFHSFLEESEKAIADVDSLQGDLYTAEGKNAEKQQEIEKLAQDKETKLKDMADQYAAKRQEIFEGIDRALNEQENVTQEDASRIQLRNDELLGEIKGKLYIITNTRDLEHEFKQLADRAQYDSGLARFLVKNYYLFMDRAQTLDTSDMDKQRAIFNINTLAGQLKEAGYTKRQLSLMSLRDSLKNSDYGTAGVKRNIQQHKAQYMRRLM